MTLTPDMPSHRHFLTRIAGLCVHVFCLALLLLSRTVDAADAGAMYQAAAVVNSREDAGERNRAFASGLEGVLLKLSGRADTAENPTIRRQIQNTQSLVEGWQYQTRVVDGVEQLYPQITYFQPEVQRVLESAGIPLWPVNRPETLIWLVTQDELGEQEFADSSSEAEAFQVLQEAA